MIELEFLKHFDYIIGVLAQAFQWLSDSCSGS